MSKRKYTKKSEYWKQFEPTNLEEIVNPENPDVYFTYDFHRSFELGKVGKLLTLDHENFVRLSDHLGNLLNKILTYDGDLSLNIFETISHLP